MKKQNPAKLVFSILVCQVAGLLGSVFTSSSIPTWYATLRKPWFNPPNWLFAPVWTLLFLMMGISLYLVLTKSFREKKVKSGLLFFGVQLALNILWSFLFFYLKNPLFGFIEILVLWVAILLTILKFWKIDRKAAYLLLPYIFWVSFATVLNLSIYVLNV
ncbi:MAG: TspO protein [Candidatus Aenigmarchaeota archaeon CG_4_10_14_0_8_um_filter_37_24]|nr:tryptophan-rich sensory protein [Candidatus Aenigmarchaeota archaeon]OIN88629.1 MAG: TspO protein [Candidatus Aenigmarchaeota archaeon CG1_02_38_14]PIV68709.1 MAG: TspO protein [Candidatus Aenigmarchaeota archaeon CG01_land_8_20_14_3_00_37_9]PIW41313.1 MAG: TspO protein [Candidatus Aenigmarchaeota archaeon CG15_BIG_FIL_POST_REV_8_21_14_020_37_27]PIX50667.1 MAG: TspO protein [Candidatus Aenigmarchaeota archaeon CG_4_8_14_3_um_filter_37_24]PIZ36312.1 MAG: TspO protein [Candidatus Aenigmarchae